MVGAGKNLLWASPPVVWPNDTGNTDSLPAIQQPTILRFHRDTFMEDFFNLLDVNPADMIDLVARYETWEKPMTAPSSLFSRQSMTAPRLDTKKISYQQRLTKNRSRTIALPATNGNPLKLYQPAHQRYYLVCASLLCPPFGIVDHRLCPRCKEKATFVVRRLVKKTGQTTFDISNCDECAYVENENGKGWQRIETFSHDGNRALVAGEEATPVFPMTYTDDDKRTRRFFAGFIPVSRREEYLSAGMMRQSPQSSTGTTGSGGAITPVETNKTALKVVFRMKVSEPWKALLLNAEKANALDSDTAHFEDALDITLPTFDETGTILEKMKDVQTNSWYILLDFQQFLATYLNDVWNAMDADTTTAINNLDQAGKNLITYLKAVTLDGNVKKLHELHPSKPVVSYKTTLYEALRSIASWRTELENNTGSLFDNNDDDTWPDFYFPFAGVRTAANTVGSALLHNSQMLTAGDMALDETANPPPSSSIDYAVVKVVAAVPNQKLESVPLVPAASHAPIDTDEAFYVIRYVFQSERCAPYNNEIISNASEPFQLAGYYDPEAPVRPLNIALPFDTSPAGLRKFPKNANFKISNVLCGQMKKVKGITFGDLVLSVLPWPFHKDLPSGAGGKCEEGGSPFGMICSLSIPIITLCAFILLSIMVVLFDIIFKWIPYFILCFPIPGMKKKG